MKKILLSLTIVMALFSGVQSASATIDKLTSTKALSEITSVEALKSTTGFILMNSNQYLRIPSSWDVYTGTYTDVASLSGQTYRYKTEDVASPAGTLIYCLEGATDNVHEISWVDDGTYGHKTFINRQPDGQNVIFGLGLNNRYGQDGTNLALWTITYSDGNGFAFESVGVPGSYLAYSGTKACPTTTAFYWKAYTIVDRWDADEVDSKATEVLASCKYTALSKAINEAGTTAEKAVAVNAAIDAINSSEAIIAKYNSLEATGKAAVALVENYNNSEYADVAALNDAYMTAVKAQGVGGDFTALLSNPDFTTSDLSGWNTNGKAAPSVDTDNHDCEFYEKTFDMSQEVKNLKKGTYEISFQAFQRPGAANTTLADNYVNDSWTSCAQLYTSAMTAEVKHICSEWQDARIYTTSGWQTDSEVTPTDGTAHYIPNSMVGGRAWFDAGYYKVTAKAVVTEDGGSLTFGFKGTQPTSSWILFDNFTLKYINTDVLVDATESEKIIATIPSGKMSKDAQTALDEAKSNLEGNMTSGAYYNELKTAITNANSSIEAYKALNDNLTFFTKKSLTSSDSYDTDYDAAKKVYDEATSDDATVNETANKINISAYRNHCKNIIANYETATALCADWDKVGTGWEYTTEAQNHGSLNNGGNMDINGGTMWENYKDGGLTEGDMKQSITVPNGKYFLKMVSFTRNSINAKDYIYIKSGDNTSTAVSTGSPTGNGGGSNPNAFINITDPVEVTNNTVEIGLHIGSGADWAAIGGVELYSVASVLSDTRTGSEYGTICMPYEFAVKNAKLYKVESVNNGKLELVEEGTVGKAGEAYVYQATSSEATVCAVANKSEAAVAPSTGNSYITGVYEDTQAVEGIYVLQTQGGVQAFYKVGAEVKPNVPAYHAYLNNVSGDVDYDEVKIVGFDSNDADAIKSVSNNNVKSGAIYNLNGQQMNKLQKGINIVNGKKYFVK